jgi:hypothetical protein
LAAIAGANPAELMSRLGHSTPAAALRYQHSTNELEQRKARIEALTTGLEFWPFRPF